MNKKKLNQFLSPAILVGLNLFLLWPWFQKGFSPHNASIEPTIIAQARFIKNSWPNTSWNPYWYLGFPSFFAGSPVLPYLMAFLGLIFPSLSLWLAYRIITGLSLMLMPIGVYCLAYMIRDRKKSRPWLTPLVSGLIFSFLPSFLLVFPQVAEIGSRQGFFPWQYFSLAYLGNGTRVLGLSFLPFCLISINKSFKNKKDKPFLLILLVAVLALIDLSSVVSLIILTILLLVSYAMVGKLKNKSQKAVSIFLFSFAILGFYYTPRFWYQALSAPSLAGQRALSVGLFLTRTLSLIVALGLGLFSVKSFKKLKKNQSFLFIFLTCFVFALLTIARFIADYDFWQDYTAWGIELGIGIALLVPVILNQIQNLAKKPILVFTSFIIILLTGLIWFPSRKSLLTPQQDISETVQGKVANQLAQFVRPNERVFMSGSPVFWNNALGDIAQVRGGVDKAATHPFWDHGAYQIRVGDDPELAYFWLKSLGVSWVVVHTGKSKEPYHDFAYPEKFENDLFENVWEKDGDIIYKITGTGIARTLKNADQFTNLDLPANGADKKALAAYVSLVDSLLSYEWLNSISLLIDTDKSNSPINLAVSFDPGWKAMQGSQKIKIKKDVLGQMVIFPENPEKIKLTYSYPVADKILGSLITAMSVFLFLFSAPILIFEKVKSEENSY